MADLHNRSRLFRFASLREGRARVVVLVLAVCLAGIFGPVCHCLAEAVPPGSPAEHTTSQRPATGSVTELSPHLAVLHGSINVGIVRHGDAALLIDCTDVGLDAALKKLGIARVEQIVFTHHHRDQTIGADALAKRGAKMGVSAGERDYFADPAAYWNDEGNLWQVYRDYRPHPLMRTRPLPVDRTLADGDELTFGPAKIRVLSTPGHTEHIIDH